MKNFSRKTVKIYGVFFFKVTGLFFFADEKFGTFNRYVFHCNYQSVLRLKSIQITGKRLEHIRAAKMPTLFTVCSNQFTVIFALQTM